MIFLQLILIQFQTLLYIKRTKLSPKHIFPTHQNPSQTQPSHSCILKFYYLVAHIYKHLSTYPSPFLLQNFLSQKATQHITVTQNHLQLVEEIFTIFDVNISYIFHISQKLISHKVSIHTSNTYFLYILQTLYPTNYLYFFPSLYPLRDIKHSYKSSSHGRNKLLILKSFSQKAYRSHIKVLIMEVTNLSYKSHSLGSQYHSYFSKN